MGPFSAGFPSWLMKFKTCRQWMKHQLTPLWVQASLHASLMSYSCQVSVGAARLGSTDRWFFSNWGQQVHRPDCANKREMGLACIDPSWVQQHEPGTTLMGSGFSTGSDEDGSRLKKSWKCFEVRFFSLNSSQMYNDVHTQSQSWRMPTGPLYI